MFSISFRWFLKRHKMYNVNEKNVPQIRTRTLCQFLAKFVSREQIRSMASNILKLRTQHIFPVV